jgi:hypothetical protein
VFRILLLLAALTCAAQDAAVRLEGGVFRVAWSAGEPAAGWNSVLAVFAGKGDVPPLVGNYAVASGTLTFTPQYPLAPGIHLRAVFHPATGAAIQTTFDLPKAAPRPSTTRVAQVYPTTDRIPENQLKFYIYFSAPMQRGDAWTHVHLLREDGSRVDLPFLELALELWDRDNMRLTVLFDPGRVKRGLLPLREVGPAIEAGKNYTFVVDREWLDGNGTPLVESYRKPLRVVASDRVPVDPAKWKITPPAAGTTDPLVVDFPEPLDYALLLHFVSVAGVEGTVAVEKNETQWRFTPKQPWKPTGHKLLVNTELEDLAGNHVGRPFDIDVFDKVTKSVTSETVSLSFRPRR